MQVRSTTILCVRRNDKVVMGGDGQVTLGENVIKHTAKKIRRLWHKNEWVFSVIDIVAALTDSKNPRDYWYKMKIRVKEEDGFFRVCCLFYAIPCRQKSTARVAKIEGRQVCGLG